VEIREGVYSFLHPASGIRHPASGIRHPGVPSFVSVVPILALRLHPKTVIYLCSDKTHLRDTRNGEFIFVSFFRAVETLSGGTQEISVRRYKEQ